MDKFFFFSRCSAVCQAGYQYNAAGRNCVACAVGTYKNVSGNTAACQACPSGYTTASTNSTKANQCSERMCIFS